MKRLINWALSDRATIRIYAQTVSLLHSESNSLKRTMNIWRVASRIGACKRSVPKEPNNFAFSILWTLLDMLLPNPCSLASLLCHSQEFPHHTIRMWQGAPLLWSVQFLSAPLTGSLKCPDVCCGRVQNQEIIAHWIFLTALQLGDQSCQWPPIPEIRRDSMLHCPNIFDANHDQICDVRYTTMMRSTFFAISN